MRPDGGTQVASRDYETPNATIGQRSGVCMKPDGALGVFITFAVAAAWLSPVQAGDEGQVDRVPAPKHHAPRHVSVTSLDDRVETLAQALGLDTRQQQQLREVLEWQHAQLSALWAEQDVPGAYRVKATQAISDQTADRIRSFLNDEQKKRYIPPRPANRASPSEDASGVQAWMDAMKKR